MGRDETFYSIDKARERSLHPQHSWRDVLADPGPGMTSRASSPSPPTRRSSLAP